MARYRDTVYTAQTIHNDGGLVYFEGGNAAARPHLERQKHVRSGMPGRRHSLREACEKTWLFAEWSAGHECSAALLSDDKTFDDKLFYRLGDGVATYTPFRC